uniref:Uncharacterized protein n=1 Tax=Sphaerodactylus townsendi TaxID=933632 RepID=A0ACB8EBH0_9SAUR
MCVRKDTDNFKPSSRRWRHLGRRRDVLNATSNKQAEQFQTGTLFNMSSSFSVWSCSHNNSFSPCSCPRLVREWTTAVENTLARIQETELSKQCVLPFAPDMKLCS